MEPSTGGAENVQSGRSAAAVVSAGRARSRCLSGSPLGTQRVHAAIRWRLASVSGAAFLMATAAAHPAATADEGGPTIDLAKRAGARVLVTVDGEPFTEYRPGGEADGGGHLPYLYPVYGPGGQALTRNWPMAEAEGEERDHPHHRSLWFAHGAVGPADGSERHDFWTGRDGSAIVHREILAAESGAAGGPGLLRTANVWLAPGGAEVLREERAMTFRAGAFDGGQAWRAIDFDIRLRAGGAAVVLGDTKEGTMAIRVAPTLRHQGERAAGAMLNSESVESAAVWGKRAAWVHYSGPVDGRPVGIAIFDHPGNFRHPTWWHARAYGLFAANPFGVHDFEKAKKGTGAWTIPAGGELRLRYRLLFHDGEVAAEQLAGELARYGSE